MQVSSPCSKGLLIRFRNNFRNLVMDTNFHARSSSSCFPAAKPPTPVAVSPCAACKILRRRCAAKCVLAPYFPPTELLKFTIAHRVFGASNIIKLFQELPESQRADAVTSIVYEATARIRDPVYGCTGAICQLQNKVKELQAELARTHADLINIQTQISNLIAIISNPPIIQTVDSSFILEEDNQKFMMELL